MNKVTNMKDIYYLASIVVEGLKDANNLKYGMIPELMYILGEEQFLKLIYYFEGQTIQIPTRNEILKVLYLIIMLYNVEVLGRDFDEVRSELKRGNSDRVPKYGTYCEFIDIIKDFDFPSKPEKF